MHTTSLIEPSLTQADSTGNLTLSSRIWISARTEGLIVGAILLLFVVLGVWYSMVVPPFETPDEIHHYAFARHLALGYDLPVQTLEQGGPWKHEGTQAPLYYFLLGRVIAGIDQSDFNQINQLNPHANLGDPLFPGNKNRMLYSAQSLPLRGTNLALHVGRWFSLFLAALTLLLTYAIARLAFPHSRTLALLTLLVVATIPQFDFISATVSNDNMIILLSTAVLYWLARLLTDSSGRSVTWYEWGILGVLLGLAVLSKLQGLGLVPLSLLVLVSMAWWRQDWRLPVRALLPIGLPLLVIAGWWYWRNYVLYGDWLGVGQLLTINGLRTEPQSLEHFWGELRGVRYSFWGLFGWFSILMPAITYPILDLVALLAGFGTLWVFGTVWQARGLRAFDRPDTRVHLLLIVWALMIVGLMLYWLTFATSGQGRLLFPAISAFGVFLVMGTSVWFGFLPETWRLRFFLLLPAGLLACSLYALTVLLPASYQAPDPVDSIPAQAQRVNLVFNDQIELMAVEMPSGRFKPGDEVAVTLYMRALTNIDKDYPLFVQLLGQENLVVGNVTTHPGWGRHPTSLWEPGKIYPNHYRIQVWDNISNRSPLLVRLYVGFINPETRLPLPIQTREGVPIPRAYVGTVDVVSSQPLDPDIFYLQPIDANFSDVIRLVGYELPDSGPFPGQNRLNVTLLWEAIGEPTKDYTAFVHLIDSDGNQVSGYDQPPAEDRFPTSHWQTGDRSLSQFVLRLPPDLPPGRYELWTGLYSDVQGAERLPVTASSHAVKDQRVRLGSLQIH